MLRVFPTVFRRNLFTSTRSNYAYRQAIHQNPFANLRKLFTMEETLSPPAKRHYSNNSSTQPTKKMLLSEDDSRLSIGHSMEIDEDSSSDESLDLINNNQYIPNSESPKWQKTITDVISSVVSIHFAQVSNFDSDPACVSEATGFVVDAERGIIMTNRHVVGAGPFMGYAVFDNHEEAVVKPIYRDPVHDFGFLQFNPKDIKHLTVQELKLRPDLAKVGVEIRVVGNDAGEKLSILAGFISRLDRNAPDYGSLSYNDFNTEYIQAAASASGGSSGSPVVNIDGYAIALQAGGSTEASTDFFLPIYRPLRALQCIQNSQPITRGTIQVQWILRPFDECRRLGLTDEAESRARELFPSIIGLLVADVVLPDGPADDMIKEGDTLISINGEDISSFIKVDEILDSNVDKDLELVVQRGGKEMTVTCKVGDLHAITPDRYLEACGASFNDMSYQMARIYAIPVKGVFVNNSSGSFNFDDEKVGWIIDSLDHQDTPDLDTFIEVLKKIPDGQKVIITYRHITDLHSPNVTIIYIDRHWCSGFRLAIRNDDTGLWDFKDLQEKPLPLPPLEPHDAKFIDIPMEEKECAKLVKSFALVNTTFPIPLDSFPFSKGRGYGVIIDAKNGFVLVSRVAVPHELLDLHITIAESISVPAKVIFMHPTQNYAIVKYDPSLVLAPVETPKFSEVPLKRGDKAIFIGYNFNLRIVTAETKVSDISSTNIPSGPLALRYRATNIEAIQIDTNVSSQCGSGVLTDKDGTIRAIWLAYLGERSNEAENIYKMAVDITEITSIIKKLQNGENPEVRIVDSEFCAIPVLQARVRGVPEDWISKMESISDDKIQFLSVTRVSYPAPNQSKTPLLPGDIILSVDGQPVNRIRDLTCMYEAEELNFKIIRRKQEMDVLIKTVPTDSFNTSQVVFWCGAVLQAPHHGVRQLMKNLPSGVYCTNKGPGSPARHYGIGTANFITHVNEQPTPDLDTFVSVVKSIPDNTYCKLRLVSFDEIPFAISIKTNYHYFPTLEVVREGDKWVEKEFK